MSHGLLWLAPAWWSLWSFTALAGWSAGRQRLFRCWAEALELAKLAWAAAPPGARWRAHLEQLRGRASSSPRGQFCVQQSSMLELMALGSVNAPLTEESQGRLPPAPGRQCRTKILDLLRSRRARRGMRNV